ncbi:unnamed protein product [Moneuplotes crassus]|uniref:1-alkyl-2-acetylglycerophosphocholine esterase n=1 Tax=Euplotes crassus TaxID=5936 RepID=A0AAD1XA61_EUPCR|nr:unnamed protein product [Moneuplotes crassus]
MAILYLGMQAKTINLVSMILGHGKEDPSVLQTIPWYSTSAILVCMMLKIYKISYMKIRTHYVLFPILRIMNVLCFYCISCIFPQFEGTVIQFVLTDGVGYALLLVMIYNGLYFIVEPDGPYGIGIKDVILKGKRNTPRILVYYPINKEEYNSKVENPSFTQELLVEGEDAIEGGSIGVAGLPGSSDAHPFLLSLFPSDPNKLKPVIEDLKYSRIRAILSSELHKDFKNGGKKLTPVIFSPGLAGSKNYYTTNCRYLASYGCIVFAISHTDGSCEFTCDYNQDPPKRVLYNHIDAKTNIDLAGRKYKDREEYFSLSVDNRTKDIETLYEYILECEFTKYLDPQKLVMYGHSLGAMTGIESCQTIKTLSGDLALKFCIAHDPYYMGKLSKIMKTDGYKVEQPLLLVTSETFKNSPIVKDYYDNDETTTKFVKNCKQGNDQVQDISWKNSGHMNQMDTSTSSPVIVRLLNFMGPINEAVPKAHELSKIVLKFLSKHECLPVAGPSQHNNE